MSHNIESMFYVNREKPWHGLGTPVESALTSKEALVAAELDWQVVQHPVYVDSNVVPNFKANVRDSDGSVLGVVTDRYKIVQNSEAFEFTDALLNYDITYETAGSLQNGRKIWLLAKMPETVIINDKVNPYLVFTNAHDGSGSIRVAITPVRVVCNNTLNLALNTTQRAWSTKHIGNIQDKLMEAKRTLELANKYMEELSGTAIEMAAKVISDAEFRDFTEMLFPLPSGKDVTDKKIENVKIIRKNLERVYRNTDDITEFIGTQWGVIQAVSDLVTHSEPLRKTQNYKENLFDKIISGHGVIDEAYEILSKMSNKDLSFA